MKSISEILNNRSKNHKNNWKFFEESSFDFLLLVNNWKNIVGDLFAKNTIPIRITSNTLTLITAHSTISHQVTYHEKNILEKIYKFFPELQYVIQSIKYQVNPSVFIERKIQQEKEFQTKIKNQRKNHKYSPEYQILRKKAEEEFKAIEDLELREIFISLKIQQESL